MLHAHGTTKYPCRIFRNLLLSGGATKSSKDVHYCVSIPRLQLTPSRAVVLGFEFEMSNRVVRKFMGEESFSAEAFLRVQITDENGLSLFGHDLTTKVEQVLKGALLDGIDICGRRYEFLAYSSSQLKECSVWMTCPESGWTIALMRIALGDFSGCKSASKYAARIGQCFSTTVEGAQGQDSTAIDDAKLRHCVIDDVWGDRNMEMCHSDGTGLIRREAVNDLLGRIPFSPKDPTDVSIVQIRFGGAKGTLTAWDFENLSAFRHHRALRSDVCLRGSMIKFGAQFSKLEVCSIGKHVPYFLNRNVVFLLHFHGVRAAIFISLQREMLDGLDNMMKSTASALRMVPKLSGPDSEHRSILLNMLKSGFSPRKEPFLFDCLYSIRSHHLFGLRKKARIYVERGAVLVGGLDESGLLPEGAIYCELSNGVSFAPLIGPVMVTSK
jgi:RNA-dependent RNA polymerase